MARSLRRRPVNSVIAIAMLAWFSACDKANELNSPSCAYAVTPSTAQFDNLGGAGSLTVQAPSACSWSVAVAGSSPWIAISSGQSGSGNGVVNFAVAANPEPTDRNTTITIGDRSVTVAQSGDVASCTLVVDLTSVTFGAEGGAAAVGVTAPEACRWTATSQAAWISISSGSNGSGNGPVEYVVAANTSPDPRMGSLTVAGQVITVSQLAEDGAVQDTVAASAGPTRW